MYDLEFQTYLSDKINIDSSIIRSLFEGVNNDEFKVAWYLINDYKINKDELGRILGDYMGFAYVDPSSCIINAEYIKKIGTDFILENRALPMYKFGRAVTVSTSNPQSPFLQDKLEKKLEEIVSLVFCFPFDIENYLKSNSIK